MTELTELEQRMAAALDRIAAAAEALPKLSTGPSEAEQALQEALDAERATNARLSERLTRETARHEAQAALLSQKLARAREQTDQLAFEAQGLKSANAALAEANAALIEAQGAGRPDGDATLAALRAELDALRAARRAEIAELEELMAELLPLADGADPEDTARQTPEDAHG
ncbi:MAG: hypothetical protein ACXIUV_05205 [Alkalilacustris sp.]